MFGFLFVLSIALLLVLGVVRPFVAEAFRISSESMAPTLRTGDHVLVTKFSYRLSDPRAGDLAVFEDAGDEASIKRVVGLPGDTVAIKDGVLVVNGEPWDEPYVDYQVTDASFFGPEEVPAGHVFVMGDNRFNSHDSRFFGAVPQEDLIGEVRFRFWPPGRTGSPA